MNPLFEFRSARRVVVTLSATFALASLGLAQSEQIFRFDGGRDDLAAAITTDASGAIIVAGRSDSLTQPVTFAVVKHSATGATQWMARYQPVADETFGMAAGVATDLAGNIYAVGSIARPTGLLQHNWDWLVVSFNANGAQRWAHRFNGSGNNIDAARDVVFDPSGALYVTGTTTTANGVDWLTTKYTVDGTLLWQRTHTSANATDDQPAAIQRTSDGGILVLGHTSNLGAGLAKDATLIKYDAAGNALWTQNFSDTAISDEFPGGFALDASGNIFVTGITVETSNPELPNLPFTLKYTAGGSLAYVVKRETAGGSSVAIGPDGHPVVAGTAIGEGASFIRPAVSKLDAASGAQIWSTPLETEGRVAVDVDGSIYLGGTRFVGTSSTPYDFFAARFTAGGQAVWTRIVTAGDHVWDTLLTADGDFLLAGVGPGVRTDMVTARFSEGFVPPPAPVPAVPSALTLAAAKSKLTLNWTDNANNESGFRIERSVNGGAFVQIAQVGANVRTFANTGLSKSNTYTYRVRAFNANGDSAFSNTATGRPK